MSYTMSHTFLSTHTLGTLQTLQTFCTPKFCPFKTLNKLRNLYHAKGKKYKCTMLCAKWSA